MGKVLITYAVEQERVMPTFPGYEIVYLCTGIGKVKAGVKLTEAILEERPDLVLNIGTAGTLRHRIGDIFVCTGFVDRDYRKADLPGVGFRVDTQPLIGAFAPVLAWAPAGICNTGDTFLTSPEELEGDVADMEGYAQAWVCKRNAIPFAAVKYVTDIIGNNSVKHWEDKLADARQDLTRFFKEKRVD